MYKLYKLVSFQENVYIVAIFLLFPGFRSNVQYNKRQLHFLINFDILHFWRVGGLRGIIRGPCGCGLGGSGGRGGAERFNCRGFSINLSFKQNIQGNSLKPNKLYIQTKQVVYKKKSYIQTKQVNYPNQISYNPNQTIHESKPNSCKFIRQKIYLTQIRVVFQGHLHPTK